MADFDKKEIEAPFNMGIATLKRLDIILQQIRSLSSIYSYDSVDKQKAHIELVRQFYINAVPLFSDGKDNKKKDKDKDKKTDIKKLSKEILELDIKRKNAIRSGSQIYQYVYDKELEKRLNQILIEIQSELKKFFMPDKRYAEGLL